MGELNEAYVREILTEKHTPPSGDDLSTRDKRDVPKVSLVQRFHCICISTHRVWQIFMFFLLLLVFDRILGRSHLS